MVFPLALANFRNWRQVTPVLLVPLRVLAEGEEPIPTSGECWVQDRERDFDRLALFHDHLSMGLAT
jgi:hypothetical protein